MSKPVKIILLVALVLGGLFGEQLFDYVKNNVDIKLPTPDPTVVVDEPSLTYKELVKPISEMEIESEDATRISNFFLEVASVVENDPGFIATTSIFRTFNMTSGGLNFAGLELKDKYPNLGEEIDAVIVASIGKQASPLTDTKRAELVKGLQAIAWAVQQ